MKKIYGIYELESLALINAITNLKPYRENRSTLRENYFPIRALSMAVYKSDTYDFNLDQNNEDDIEELTR